MWTWHIQIILSEIERDMKILSQKFLTTIVYDEKDVKLYDKSLQIIEEFRILISQIKWDPDNEEVEQFSLDDTPILGRLAEKLGGDNVLGKLFQEIADEIKKKRAAEREKQAKDQDNKHNKDMVDGVKDKKGKTKIKLTPKHGTTVEYEHEDPVKEKSTGDGK